MKSVEELKEKADMDERMEETKQALEKSGIELTNEEQEAIDGGFNRDRGDGQSYYRAVAMVKQLIVEFKNVSDPNRKKEIQAKLRNGDYRGHRYVDIVKRIDPSVLA